jgi:hypothetical protein
MVQEEEEEKEEEEEEEGERVAAGSHNLSISAAANHCGNQP